MKNKKTSENTQDTTKDISFWTLFRYASKRDYFLMFIGAIGAGVDGVAMPFLALLLGSVADDFGPNHTGQEIVDSAAKIAWEFAVVGAISMVTSYIGFASWMSIGEQQSIEIRKRYFKSLLSQEIAFYDSINPNELSSKIAEECFNIQQGIGDKVAVYLNAMSMMVAAFVIGYIKGWQLALVLTACIPLMALSGTLFVSSMQKLTRINNAAYSKAGAISEEVLNAIRTVVSLGGQAKESKRYEKTLDENKGPIVKFSILAGFSIGLVYFTIYAIYALGFYVGSLFIEHEIHISEDTLYSAGRVLTVFFSILLASFAPARATTPMKNFAIAKTSGAKAFEIIDRKGKINPQDSKGLKPTHVEGNFQFRNVIFAYPSKPDRIILNGVTFDIRRGEKTALVGESGCGKTTCLQLLERFYDYEDGNGAITLDGNELKNLNLKWMRDNIGYVGQEPVLFATSIRENLLMAKDGATDDQIWDALKKANAAEFIQGLPDKLNTFVGANGTMLSGGQKQRLAIARAILKNPQILLLDEATSALDRKNEMEIQKTLDEIASGRTTIVIAHRLSTIQNADHIVVFDQGKVVEEGRHEELVAKHGRYYALQHLQLQAEEKNKNAEDSKKEQMISTPHLAIKDKKPRQVRSKDEIEINVASNEQTSTSKVAPKGKSGHRSLSDVQVFKRLLKYSWEDLHLIILGFIAALAQGAVMPVNSITLSRMLMTFAVPDAPDFRSRSNLLSLMFLVLALISLAVISIQMSCFNLVAERLSRKIRALVFKKYVKMPIGWFDQPENSPGALGSKLATDAALMNTLTGSVLGAVFQAISSLITCIAISFTASWQLGLVGMGLTPLRIIAGKIRAELDQNFMLKGDEAYQESISFVSEAVNNMRTVLSFGNEEKLLANYSQKLQKPLKEAVKTAQFSGLAFGAGQFIDFGTNALIFYVGALFMRDVGLGYQDMFQCIICLVFTGMSIGTAMQAAPDYGAAKEAAFSIFKILDMKPAIDIDDPKQTVRKPIVGDVEFRDVWFKYPSREKQIFKGLNFKIDASSKVALVGPSGCGKSTILALLQRFYDPDQGEILVDGINVKNYDLKHLRESFGVVSQEPVLFNGTIEYNIKYSKENATNEEMKQVAIKANALGFIEKNEFDAVGDAGAITIQHGTGFQRKVGPKGSQMSGGQKQRIAIARAILKNPSFLILDEATSALDAENEKVVQSSLDQIMEGKTSLIVAHRISTIKDADEIIVFAEGEIMERGNYKQLTDKFYKLERGMNTGM